jgi:LmbE family N-acetylglucosaminyl deacetylase
MSHRIRVALVGVLLLLATRGESVADPAAEKPQPLDILVVAPHPDDEAIGCTGVMLQAIEQKQRVGIVLMTNGDAFEGVTVVAKKTKDQVGPADYVKLAALRQKHTLGAMGRIGIREADLMFLGYPDGGIEKLYRMEGKQPLQSKFTEKMATYGVEVRDYHSVLHGRPAPYTKAAMIEDLQEIIKTRQPKEIFVTNDADSHPDHRASGWFVRDAAKAAGFRGKLFTYVVHGKPPKEAPARTVALTKTQLARKKAVIEEYQVGLSPLHDKLAEMYAKPEELFWEIRSE